MYYIDVNLPESFIFLVFGSEVPLLSRTVRERSLMLLFGNVCFLLIDSLARVLLYFPLDFPREFAPLALTVD